MLRNLPKIPPSGVRAPGIIGAMTTQPTPRGTVVVVGTLNLDQVVRAPRLPADGETVLGLTQSERPGGKGANQAKAAAQVGRTVLIGAVGDDAAGRRMIDDQRGSGVDVTWVQRVSGISGRAVIEVDAAGTNRIIVVPGANAELSVAHTVAALDGADPAVVLTQLETPPEITAATAHWCRTRRRRFILNPSPVAPLDDSILASADPVIVNEVEERYYGGAQQLGTRCRSVIVTAGRSGALVVTSDGRYPIAVRDVTTTDTTGAGDVFAGTLAAHVADGRDLVDSARRAAGAATDFLVRR